jgi:hypothetical protein
MAFGQEMQPLSQSWGVAPGYGEARPSAKTLWHATRRIKRNTNAAILLRTHGGVSTAALNVKSLTSVGHNVRREFADHATCVGWTNRRGLKVTQNLSGAIHLCR